MLSRKVKRRRNNYKRKQKAAVSNVSALIYFYSSLMTSMYMLQQVYTKSYEFMEGELMNITTQNRVFS